MLLFLALAFATEAAEVLIADGSIRVQALSPILVRVEPKGPQGFYDNTSFMVADRGSFDGIVLTKINESAAGGTWLKTDAFIINVKATKPLPTPPPSPQPTFPPSPMCTGHNNTDIVGGIRSSACHGVACLTNATTETCCQGCEALTDCVAWILDPSDDNCWWMKSAFGMKKNARISGGKISPAPPPPPAPGNLGISVTVLSPSGTVLLAIDDLGTAVQGNLHWPSPPGSAKSKRGYAIKDYPRFYTPEWGPAVPIPDAEKAKVDPALITTNGYDFGNNQDGDTYIFLLGDDLSAWHAARNAFITLTGPTPLLPDYAWGTWFTYWHGYRETEAKDDILRWASGNLPIDVWALDMNWRLTTDNKDHFYNHPNLGLMPGLNNSKNDSNTEWFEFLKGKKLRTYFNDHPFPVDNQTSAKEVAFRWEGLSSWMDKGLDFWWFDRNWHFSIPPPNMPPVGQQYNPPGGVWNISNSGGVWEGMSNAAWGSHLYYSTVKYYDSTKRPGSQWDPRPITLTKFSPPNCHDQPESPAHHRYPVWWTGDGCSLETSVSTMVDSGVHDFKPYVHSDCGGDYRGKVGGDLMLDSSLRARHYPALPWIGSSALDLRQPHRGRDPLLPDHALQACSLSRRRRPPRG